MMDKQEVIQIIKQAFNHTEKPVESPLLNTDSDGYKSYFARNIGFIKGTYKGKTITQLAKIKKK
ncbi:hypothetical protein SAMN05428981_101192 [Bacillus sp. OV194]|nr:hypothetical protein SAMN05428981_101192 [Bacillus sp. OV194]